MSEFKFYHLLNFIWLRKLGVNEYLKDYFVQQSSTMKLCFSQYLKEIISSIAFLLANKNCYAWNFTKAAFSQKIFLNIWVTLLSYWNYWLLHVFHAPNHWHLVEKCCRTVNSKNNRSIVAFVTSEKERHQSHIFILFYIHLLVLWPPYDMYFAAKSLQAVLKSLWFLSRKWLIYCFAIVSCVK